MAAVVQAGECIGQRQPLQLALALALAQPGHQGAERPSQIAHLTAVAGGEVDRQVAGRHARGGFREPDERAGDEQTTQESQQPDDDEQRGDEQHGTEP